MGAVCVNYKKGSAMLQYDTPRRVSDSIGNRGRKLVKTMRGRVRVISESERGRPCSLLQKISATVGHGDIDACNVIPAVGDSSQ